MKNLKNILASLAFAFAITAVFAFTPAETTSIQQYKLKIGTLCEPLDPQDVPSICAQSGNNVCTFEGDEVWYNTDGAGCDFQLRRP